MKYSLVPVPLISFHPRSIHVPSFPSTLRTVLGHPPQHHLIHHIGRRCWTLSMRLLLVAVAVSAECPAWAAVVDPTEGQTRTKRTTCLGTKEAPKIKWWANAGIRVVLFHKARLFSGYHVTMIIRTCSDCFVGKHLFSHKEWNVSHGLQERN